MDVNRDFWVKETQKTFTSIFNDNNSNKGHWGVDLKGQPLNIKIPNNGDVLLSNIFTNENIKLLTGKDDFSIPQFICLVSIILNETGGKLVGSITEFGSLKYMFNKGSFKASYNSSNTLGNIDALTLFKSETFLNVPERLNMVKPKNINNKQWSGIVYPDNENVGGYLPIDNYKVGLISECDFYKFRGRGYIQTTGRGNYKKFFEDLFSVRNQMSNDVKNILNKYSNVSLDIMATKITNNELDTIFKDPLANMMALKSHYSINTLKKLYNPESPTELFNLVYKYGKQISGGAEYANHYSGRVFEIFKNIPNFV